MAIGAPKKFRGDLRKFNKETLSFDSKIVNDPHRDRKDVFPEFGIVTIKGSNTSASRDFVPRELGEGWQTFRARLNAKGWGLKQSEWEELLANVEGIEIDLEYRENYKRPMETVGVDNVTLSKKIVPIFGK